MQFATNQPENKSYFIYSLTHSLFISTTTHSLTHQTKFFLYITTVAATNDVETQRNGLVVLVWFDPTFRLSLQVPAASRIHWVKTSCVRCSAIHICHPDTPANHFRRSVVAMRAVRGGVAKRIKFHVGEPVEVRYSLQGYGIPTETIPITWTGTIKSNVHRSWLKLRHALEDFHANANSNFNNNFNTFQTDGNNIVSDSDHSMAIVVECPSINDVLFRQGTSLYSHPGNARFRSLVEHKVFTNLRSEQIHALAETSTEDLPMTFSTADLVAGVIDEIINKNNGRVLVWAPNYTGEQFGCWCTLTNRHQIYNKIEYIVREFLRGISVTNNNNNNKSATAEVANPNGNTNDNSDTNTTMNTSLHRKNQRNHQTVDSSTSIFRMPDSSSPGLVQQQQRHQQLHNQQQRQLQSTAMFVSNQRSNQSSNISLPNKRHKSREREPSTPSSDGDYSSDGVDGCCGFIGKSG